MSMGKTVSIWVEQGFLHHQTENGGYVREATQDEKLLSKEIERLKTELKKFDPDPVVCECHEALCPHTPIAKMPRQELVDHFKWHIRTLESHHAKEEEIHWKTRRSLIAERDNLRVALGRYGKHEDGCRFKGFSFKLYDRPCTCGLALHFSEQP